MSIRDEQITNTTITPPAEQRASGEFSKPVRQGPPSRLEQVGHFVRHYMEMCLAMCFGLLLSILLFWAAAQIGYPDLRQQFPEVSILVIASFLALPMAAWMLFRGMEWRPTLEMAGATFGLGIVLSGLVWLGVLPRSSLLQISLCCLACPLCFVVMLFRLDLYTGRKGHHMQAA